jgi:predicted dithiol-disulfide oxidoreductase (DUF899 family)
MARSTIEVGHPNVVSHAEWLAARREFLTKEKEFSRLRDELSRQRRSLPWEKVEKRYEFDSTKGKATLADVFDGRSQLIVYHFMFAPDWEEGCKSCSFWADNFNGIPIHLNHRDVTFTAVSRAPLAKIDAYKKRMGWSFPWVSSDGSEVRPINMSDDIGISVFYKTERDEVFHTYSCYSRGVDMLNGAYHYLDLVPESRDEDGLKFPMEWVRRHDQY